MDVLKPRKIFKARGQRDKTDCFSQRLISQEAMTARLMRCALVFAAAACLDGVECFTVVSSQSRLARRVHPQAMCGQARSCKTLMTSASDDAASDATSVRGLKSIKSELMKLLTKGTGLTNRADPLEVTELVLELEGKNPTQQPAASDLLNGDWEMVHSGGYAQGFIDSPTRELALLAYTGGYRPGLLATLMDKLPAPLLDVDNVILKISPGGEKKRTVEGSVRFGVAGQSEQLTTQGTLEERSPVRLTETRQRSRVFGQNIDLPGTLRWNRDLLVTFLDDDFLIARDDSGVSDVWLRKLPVMDSSSAANSPAEPAGSRETFSGVVEDVTVESKSEDASTEAEQSEE